MQVYRAPALHPVFHIQYHLRRDISDRGSNRSHSYAEGLEADLVVLNGDPSRDIKGFGAVALTVQGGEVIYRSGR